MARTHWISKGAEQLAFSEAGKDGFHCDVAIVGSGYGGAVAAARLAGSTDKVTGDPARIWVLERGRERLPGQFPERFADLPGEVRFNWGERQGTRGQAHGLFDLRIGEDVSALLGNGLGGGSLINAGVLAEPDAAIFRKSPWPWQFADGALDRHFTSVREMLGAATVPEPRPLKFQALDALAKHMGAPRAEPAHVAVTLQAGFNKAGVEQEKCIQCGDCFTGCNHWAKNTLAMNYLPFASARGAELFTGITVLALRAVDGGWELETRFTDQQIRDRVQADGPRLRARRVILAAGTYGSTGILLRSQDALRERLSHAQLGARFSANGDMIAAGYGLERRAHSSADERQAPWNRNIGPTITGMIDRREGPVPFVVEELAIPAALRRPFEEVVTTYAVLDRLGDMDWSRHRRVQPGPDPSAIDQDALQDVAVFATIGCDDAGGRMKQTPRAGDEPWSDDGVRVEWKGVGKQPVFTQTVKALERALAKAGAKLIPNPMWRILPGNLAGMLTDRDVGGTVLTVHPLGGCAMAESADDGVVNHFGQVFSSGHGPEVHETLVVLDGSIVPTALGTNPCLTIAALAEYAVPQLMQQWNLSPLPKHAQGKRLPDLPQPQQRKRSAREWRAPRSTEIRLAERLAGPVALQVPMRNSDAHRDFHAELEIRYRPIPDLERFIAAPAKNVEIPHALLRLRGNVPNDPADEKRGTTSWSGTVPLTGNLRFLEREPSSFLRRVLRVAWAWALNRGIREIVNMMKGAGTGNPGKKLLDAFKIVRRWLAISSHAGEARLMLYELEFMEDVNISVVGAEPGIALFRAGDRLLGRKRLAYIAAATAGEDAWPSPWDQLTKLELRLQRNGESVTRRLGTLTVDLPYFVQHFAALLQIGAQENQPRAIADLCSLFTYLGRLIGKIHFFTLRAPDYPNPYPVYEFDAEEERRAKDAAAEIRIRIVNRREHRLPGAVVGLDHSVTPLRPLQPNGARLTRYFRPGLPPLPETTRPVLLIHGLGASGNTFTLPTVDCNLVQFLVQEGFDPWVLDLSTSIGVEDSKQDWNFDAVARQDIPAALHRICDTTRSDVDVVAHCIGSAMFCMAMLSGAAPRGMVRSAVLSQVGPLLEFPPTNRFRGYIASYFKHYLDIDEFDTASELSTFNRFLDRILAAYPYPRHEWHHHLPLIGTVRHEAFCLRAFGIYGRLFEHHNLNQATLDRLADYLGHIRYRTYQQTIFYATMRRLTDELGRNRYVTSEKVGNRLDFPICLLHGAENEVFDPRSSRRSFDLLASIFWSDTLEKIWTEHPAGRYDSAPYAEGKPVRLVEIPGYGHQDCMIGEHAHRDVFPRITAFLREDMRGRNITKPRSVVRPARMGPIVGWVRREPDATGRAKLKVRLLFAPNQSRSQPEYAMSIVLRPGSGRNPVGSFHQLRTPSPAEQQEEQWPPTQAIDVEIEDEERDCHIVVLTVHSEQYEEDPLRAISEPRVEDALGEDVDRFPNVRLPTSDEARVMAAEKVQAYVEPVLDTCRDLVGTRRRPMTAGRYADDRRYATPVSAAILSPGVIRAARTERREAGALTVALANCRYAATPIDREAADATFGRLRDLLEAQPTARTPQLLFLAGDAIYADATYGIFDPTMGVERYDQRYLEAWTAPNAREVLRRLPTYPMLDDHEVEENFEGRRGKARKQEQVTEGLKAFDSFQLLMTPAIEKPTQLLYAGRSYAFSAGGFEFFVADTRSERRRGRGRQSVRATIMEGQLEWPSLLKWLTRTADSGDLLKPKFIVSPSVVLPWSRETRGDFSYQLRSDAWDGYPQSLCQLFDFIAEKGIQNVVFLSGDYHASLFSQATLCKKGRDPVRIYSVVGAGLYAPYPFANTVADDLELAYDGTLGDWFKCPDGGQDLHVQYTSELVGSRDAFALVGADRVGTDWILDVAYCSPNRTVALDRVDLSHEGKRLPQAWADLRARQHGLHAA